MKETRIEKGITLIQLIITIIVLLILAAVAISGIQDQGIIEHAQNSTSEYNESLAQKDYLTKNYIEFLNANEGASSGENDGTGETTGSDTGKITLNKTALSVEIESGSTATETLTATLTDATGTLILTWTSSNTDVATVIGSGNTVTVTIKKAGTATITVSYGEISATCNITVTEATFLEFSAAYNGVLVTAKAKEGITWEEFINNPEYNTIGLWLWNDAVMYGEQSVVEKFNSFLNDEISDIPANTFWGRTSSSEILLTFKWEEIDSEYFKDGIFILGSPTVSKQYTKEELEEVFETAGGAISYWTLEP